jgi:hypothetical protein
MSPLLELLPNQTRQYIDAETVFLELRRARWEAAEVRGSMFWRTQGKASYLIRESAGGAQKSLGSKSADTEAIFDKFKLRKDQASSRLAALAESAHNQQRLNKALRVGRVPGIVVKTLNALDAAGLQDHFITIGTHALYAFESACGVRFVPDALATQDLDLLFDSRKRMSFVSHMRRMDSSFIGALQKADPSFRVMPDQKQTAINSAGFEVDVIRRTAKDGDPHPFRMSADENDLWAVQVEGTERMLSAPRFSQVVVAETGHMAVMNTINPVTFVAIKRMIAAAPNRDPKKRPKDMLQADLVESLIKTHMPQFAQLPNALG